jgi:hypothetical protein
MLGLFLLLNKILLIKKGKCCWVPVAHTCNPSYSGGRDQKDHSSKPAQGNSSRHPILKKPITKKGLVEWLKVQALSSNPRTTKKKKKKRKMPADSTVRWVCNLIKCS